MPGARRCRAERPRLLHRSRSTGRAVLAVAALPRPRAGRRRGAPGPVPHRRRRRLGHAVRGRPRPADPRLPHARRRRHGGCRPDRDPGLATRGMDQGGLQRRDVGVRRRGRQRRPRRHCLRSGGVVADARPAPGGTDLRRPGQQHPVHLGPDDQQRPVVAHRAPRTRPGHRGGLGRRLGGQPADGPAVHPGLHHLPGGGAAVPGAARDAAPGLPRLRQRPGRPAPALRPARGGPRPVRTTRPAAGDRRLPPGHRRRLRGRRRGAGPGRGVRRPRHPPVRARRGCDGRGHPDRGPAVHAAGAPADHPRRAGPGRRRRAAGRAARRRGLAGLPVRSARRGQAVVRRRPGARPGRPGEHDDGRPRGARGAGPRDIAHLRPGPAAGERARGAPQARPDRQHHVRRHLHAGRRRCGPHLERRLRADHRAPGLPRCWGATT